MKVAVVSIGINYRGQRGELQGCINDSDNFVTWARETYGSSLRQVVQMTDDLPRRHRWYPTRRRIEKVLSNMRKRVNSKGFTHFLVHYSGHGAQVKDTSGDELDGKDEVLVPVDYTSKGVIRDDWLLRKFIQRVHSRVRFFGLIDACHSGTMLDLRYRNNKWANRKASSAPNAMMISGAADHQYAWDVWDATYGRCGAMTASFLRAMDTAGMSTPARAFVDIMRADLDDRGYPQTPQLATSRKVRRHDPLLLR